MTTQWKAKGADRMDEQLRIEVKGSRTFVRDVLREIDREDLLVELDEENLTGQVLAAINELVEAEGGRIELPEVTTSMGQEHSLGALIGGRYHINIKRVAWKSLIVSVPLIVNLIRGQVDPTAYISLGGSVLALIDVYRDNLQELAPDEITAYLAIKVLRKQTQKPVGAADVTSFLNAAAAAETPWAVDEVQKLLERMAQKKVLMSSLEGYRIVV